MKSHITGTIEQNIWRMGLPGFYLGCTSTCWDHQSCQSSLARSGDFSLPAAVKPWGVCIQLVDLWWSFCAHILQAQVIDRKVGKLVINISWLVVYLPLWKILVRSWSLSEERYPVIKHGVLEHRSESYASFSLKIGHQGGIYPHSQTQPNPPVIEHWVLKNPLVRWFSERKPSISRSRISQPWFMMFMRLNLPFLEKNIGISWHLGHVARGISHAVRFRQAL